MPRKITFQIATAKGISNAQGYKVHLMVGTHRHTFMLQFDGKRPSILADYASGYKVQNLAPLALARYVANPYNEHDTYRVWRSLAQETIDGFVRAHGQEEVLARFARVPRINA